jgi:predicted O-linked N-acetylglucosamine transferase (SPINDLY family)
VAEACFADAEPVDLDDMAGETPERLRIGYISDGFHDTEIGRLFSGVFNAHDRKRFETFAYQQNVHTDPVTTRLKANANHWKEIHDVDDDTLAYIMASDGLDILVDLCSYTGEQRAGLLARKPAAVVASWLSWPFGAGLPALDCVISDAAALEADRAAAGGVACLPTAGGLLAYDAAALTIDFDAFGSSPAKENGFVTFGAVCDASRITPETARVFSRVLRAVPGAYLMFGYVDTICPAVVQRLRELFSHFGMLSRIAFQTPVDDRPANQQFHSNVDIVLDSFPVNGVFETCESLRAGVPVVTLAGDRRAGCMGASILRAAGKAEWIAESEDAFVNTAASLAATPGELADLRKTLGRAVADSPLCDLQAFTAGLEEVYERIARDKGLR